MITGDRLLFVGNRPPVLNELIDRCGPPALTIAIENSYLAWNAPQAARPFLTVSTKAELRQHITNADIDHVICNGVPFRLPISALQRHGHPNFINVHPGRLPEMRGPDPVNGAILRNAKAGATAHLMDDEIDTGPILEKISFAVPEAYDVRHLYQNVFQSERAVFRGALDAMEQGRAPQKQPASGSGYYKIRLQDKELSALDDDETIVRKVRAFASPNQGARLYVAAHVFVVRRAQVIDFACMPRVVPLVGPNSIAVAGPNFVIVERRGAYLLLDSIDGPTDRLTVGTEIFAESA